MNKLGFGWLAWWCCSVFAMPETEFKQLRQTAISAAQQDYQAGILRIDEILQQYQLQLTLEQRIRLLYNQADFYFKSNDTHQSITLLAQAKTLSLESGDPAILYSYHNLLADIFSQQGLYQPALLHYRQALEKAQFLDNSYFAKQTENNLALILIKQRQFAEARRYLTQFYQHGLTTQDVSVQGVALNNLGEAALAEGNIELARDLHQQALALRLQHQLTLHISWSYLNLAKVAKAEQQWTEVIHYAQQTLTLREGKLDLGLIEPGLLLAEALHQTNQKQQASQQLQQTLALATRRQQAEWQLKAWQLQSEFYQEEQPKLALQALQQALKLQQTLAEKRYDVAIAQSTAEIGWLSREAELQQSRKQHEMTQLAAAAQQQKFWIVFSATLLILLLTLFFFMQIRRKNRDLEQSLLQLQRTKKQLVEAEKMASLTSLVAGIAHQLNTPIGIILTAVTSCAEHIRDLQHKFSQKSLSANELQQSLQDNQQMLQLAESSSHKAAELVQRFKQISASSEQLLVQTLQLRKFLPEMMHHLLQSAAPSHPVELQCEGPDILLRSDPERLTKVFSALTENALIHGLAKVQQPQLRLTWQLQPATEDHGSDQVCLYFADNGCGILPEEAKKVFDPFFSTRLGQGHLGLGLNIAFNTLQQLEGQITLLQTTSEHPGCRFKIELPLQPQTSKASKATPESG